MLHEAADKEQLSRWLQLTRFSAMSRV